MLPQYPQSAASATETPIHTRRASFMDRSVRLPRGRYRPDPSPRLGVRMKPSAVPPRNPRHTARDTEAVSPTPSAMVAAARGTRR